jgi:protein gp37
MSDLFHEKVSDKFVDQVWRVMEETPRHHYQILTKRPERMLSYVNQRCRKTLQNVWLGTSVENYETKDRILYLQRTRAAVRFVSFEPLIGSVGSVNLRNIDWAIVGGESGISARPVKEQWITEIHAQCKRNDTAFFFKQWGAWGQDNKRRSKKANGRTYLGRTWDEMPTVRVKTQTEY